MNLFGEEDNNASGAYRVLARKYRPTNFDDLVGQDVLVRTLSNAIKTGRLAHAFLLTGIRGVGKTTTARIIARALNCIGEDGKGGPTIQPCGVCSNCKMIAEDRHMDVMEMDAASRTGVNDIRELIETVHYAPTQARYKIYIIDEVHMLSNSAFNALLKTLEEPPPHVKFIFATTELHKIPVTILSRCQTFELKRVEGETLTGHLGRICDKEQVPYEAVALQLIAAAAEGSVRDSLSLLDQAIAHGTDDEGKSHVQTQVVRDMLGMADRSHSFELLGMLFKGEVKEALFAFRKQYEDGADPLYIIQELMELVHLVTRVKLVPELAEDAGLAESERNYAKALAEKMAVSHLTRAWQLLAKGLQEARYAPNSYMAAEMVLIRLMHASNLPNPSDLLRNLQQGNHMNSSPRGGGGGNAGGAGVSAPSVMAIAVGGSVQHVPSGQPTAMLAVHNFEQAVELFRDQREMVLYSHLLSYVRLVGFQRGRIEVNLLPGVAPDFVGKVGKYLTDWTGERWIVSVTSRQGESTIKERQEAAKKLAMQEAMETPLVQRLLKTFSGAKVIDFVQAIPQKEQIVSQSPQMQDDNLALMEMDGEPIEFYFEEE